MKHMHDDKCGHKPMKKKEKSKKQEKAPKGDSPKKRPAKTGDASKKKISKVMKEFKEKKLHSGSKKGPKVKSRKQALAIAISESKKAKKK